MSRAFDRADLGKAMSKAAVASAGLAHTVAHQLEHPARRWQPYAAYRLSLYRPYNFTPASISLPYAHCAHLPAVGNHFR
jgi:hypothetical protein